MRSHHSCAKMGSKKRQRLSFSKRDDIVAPMKTLDQSDSAILVGTLVWAKHKDWPWWPGKRNSRPHSAIIFNTFPSSNRSSCD